MVAYVINDMEVTDPQLLDEYKKLSPATVEDYGGRFLARESTRVLYETKSIPEPVPMSVIQNAIDPSPLREFAAAGRK